MARLKPRRLALLASCLGLLGPAAALSPLQFHLGIVLWEAIIPSSGATADADPMTGPVPSSSQNNEGRSHASPPAGPLPDPLDCSEDGTCSAEEEEEAASERAEERPSSTPTLASESAVPTGKYYCPGSEKVNKNYVFYSTDSCFYDKPSASSTKGDFVSPELKPGQVAPIVWRNNGKLVSQYMMQVGLPQKLITTLLDYCDELGITDEFREYTTTDPIEPTSDEDRGEFFDLTDGSKWYAQRPDEKWQSNMHWISPADEITHEAYLRVLGEGGFDEVLEGIGQALELEGLVVYQLSFIAVSHSEGGYKHTDTKETNGGVYNVIIPLLLEDDVPPELILWDDADEELRGGYKYQVGVAAMTGDDANHGTHECDYRNLPNARHGGYFEDEDGRTKRRAGMRLAATLFIGEIYPDNVAQVAHHAITQIFPLPDEKWLLAQEARHWQADWSDYEINNRLVGDEGRWAYRADDELGEKCEKWAEEGLCESDVEGTRKKCAFSCKVYIEEGPTTIEKLEITEANGVMSEMVNICSVNRIGGEECQTFEDDMSVPGDFITPDLEPGEMFPMIWREDTKPSSDYAFQIGLPPELTEALLEYCNELGITEVMRQLTGDDPLEALDGETAHEFTKLRDRNKWYVQRPAQIWKSNMHWISPADEKTHEDYLKVLAAGNFDKVLQSVGSYLGLEGLAAYHLTFIGVSHSEQSFMHRDTHHTGASVYNVIIPLILENNAPPELVMSDWYDNQRTVGALKYKVGTAAMMGDDNEHGTAACDYRATKGMRLAATVYIADINEENSKKIAYQTLTQVFPPANSKWLMAQSGRHWNEKGTKSLANDAGRNSSFAFRDTLSDCRERVKDEKCYDDLKYTRKKCLRSCGVYQQLSGIKKDPEFVFEKYVPGQYIHTFFEGLDEGETCIDKSEECAALSQSGSCMTAEDKMKDLGCDKSCLYCLTRENRDMFSLGVDQAMEMEEDGKSEYTIEIDKEEQPSPSEVAKVMFDTELFFINKIFAYDDMGIYRLSCKNSEKSCAVWAAMGYCEAHDWMGQRCAAACKSCGINEQPSDSIIDNVPEFVFEKYVPGQYIHTFFEGLDEDDTKESCIDESEECAALSQSGSCMTEEDKMKDLGCDKSCLYCLTRENRDMFSLGVDQAMEKVEEDDESEDTIGIDDDEEEEQPSPSEVAKVMFDTELYFIEEIFAYDDMGKYRLSCQNFKKNCAVWAAMGSCEAEEGWMGRHCAAACKKCPMVDISNRCPIDPSTNIFGSEDINKMFERWFEEAGQDTSLFSPENLPTGGAHPYGEMSVITSPYHDKLQYVTEEEKDSDPEQIWPLPWVVSIDGFLTDEECGRLIEFGGAQGYERSEEYSDERNIDGSADHVQSTGRTSTNTFCGEECSNDPMVKGVIERITKLTGIPHDNYEPLQLVRYEPDQFYEQHHDLSFVHYEHPYGPRILTFFLYLNDVESGGGTKFEFLNNFTAQPKKGSALVWPSVTTDLAEMEDWTWHEALPVETGIKFGANTWIHLRDYQNVPEYC